MDKSCTPRNEPQTKHTLTIIYYTILNLMTSLLCAIHNKATFPFVGFTHITHESTVKWA